jgi:hypothetical protein
MLDSPFRRKMLLAQAYRRGLYVEALPSWLHVTAVTHAVQELRTGSVSGSSRRPNAGVHLIEFFWS